jgi:hypothetical protein
MSSTQVRSGKVWRAPHYTGDGDWTARSLLHSSQRQRETERSLP